MKRSSIGEIEDNIYHQWLFKGKETNQEKENPRKDFCDKAFFLTMPADFSGGTLPDICAYTSYNWKKIYTQCLKALRLISMDIL